MGGAFSDFEEEAVCRDGDSIYNGYMGGDAIDRERSQLVSLVSSLFGSVRSDQ